MLINSLQSNAHPVTQTCGQRAFLYARAHPQTFFALDLSLFHHSSNNFSDEEGVARSNVKDVFDHRRINLAAQKLRNQLAAVSFRERPKAEAHGKSFAVKGSHKPGKTAGDVDFFFAKTPDNEQPQRR